VGNTRITPKKRVTCSIRAERKDALWNQYQDETEGVKHWEITGRHERKNQETTEERIDSWERIVERTPQQMCEGTKRERIFLTDDKSIGEPMWKQVEERRAGCARRQGWEVVRVKLKRAGDHVRGVQALKL